MYVQAIPYMHINTCADQISGLLSTATMPFATSSSSLVRMSMRKEAMLKPLLCYGRASVATYRSCNYSLPMEQILKSVTTRATIFFIPQRWTEMCFNSRSSFISLICWSTRQTRKAIPVLCGQHTKASQLVSTCFSAGELMCI